MNRRRVFAIVAVLVAACLALLLPHIFSASHTRKASVSPNNAAVMSVLEERIPEADARSSEENMPVTEQRAQPSGRIRLLSWNIRHGADEKRRPRLDRIAARLHATSPDIIGLQEVDRFWIRSGLIDQAGQLAKELGYHHVLGSNVRLGMSQYGNALVSRWPIVTSKNYPLPSQTEPRGALWAVVRTPDGDLNVLVTHLGLRETERAQQLDALQQIVSGLTGPIVLLGDFNAEAEAEFAELTSVTRGAGLKTFPATSPTSGIDHIFVSRDLQPGIPEAVADASSDHRPVLVDLPASTVMLQR